MPFSGYAEVVESKCYQHEDGRQVSLFTSHVPAGFVLTVKGWDIRWTGDGTVGRCKPPFATKDEADAYAKDWNDRRREAEQAYHDQISDRLVDEAFEDIGH